MKQSHTVVRLLAVGVLLAGGLTSHWARADEGEKAITIPDTPAAIWQSIDSEVSEMNEMIQAGTLKELHHHAFAVRDLVAALPAKSASLPGDKLAKVKSDGKFVATLAERLDAAGDSNDQAASASNLEKLQKVLASLRANYPDAKPAADSGAEKARAAR